MNGQNPEDTVSIKSVGTQNLYKLTYIYRQTPSRNRYALKLTAPRSSTDAGENDLAFSTVLEGLKVDT